MRTFDVAKDYSREDFRDFLRDFLPDDFEPLEEETYFDFNNIERGCRLGECKSLDLDIFEFRTKSGHDPRVTLTREVVSCMKKHGYSPNALAVFYSAKSHGWRLSLITTEYSIENGKVKTEHSNPRRFSFRLGEGCKAHTPETMLLNRRTVSSLDDLKERFDIEVVGKEFFDKYKTFYEDFVQYITGNRYVKVGGKYEKKAVGKENKAIFSQFKEIAGGDHDRACKLVRDYVKKLMGRLVFLHFLQKKGWLGVSEGKPWGSGDRSFIQNLFANACDGVKDDFLSRALEPLFFRTLNTDRGKAALAPDEISAVYGGNVRIPYLNGGLFEEDELDRMRVRFNKEHFSDLLEFFSRYNFTIDESDPTDKEIGIDPEMLGKIFENLLEDNKDKGAFYTPKEIVQYMCRESLAAYLCADGGADAGKVRRIMERGDSEGMGEGEKSALLGRLRAVKVCDPAVGSGAFPMGMMNELLALRSALGDTEETSEIKKQIVRDNIYGVDIEKGAVDIARLRFWLAIIVDEKEPIPLPNLDYKIMRGNSLLESFEGVDLSALTKDDGKFRFAADEIKYLLELLKTYFYKHTEKEAIRDSIKAVVIDLVRNRGIDDSALEKLERMSLHDNGDFFLWHTWFGDVFNGKDGQGGFDIVIGNPPYVNIQLMSDREKDLYKKHYSVFMKRCDMFALFMELGLLKIASTKGIVSLIVPSVVHSNMSYQKLREIMLQNRWLQEVCYTGGDVFNAPTVDTTILICNRKGNERIILKNAVDFSDHKTTSVDPDYFSSFGNIISVGGDSGSSGIFDKLFNKNFEPLEAHFSIYQGIVTGNNTAFIFETEAEAVGKGADRELLRPLCHGRDIEKYLVRSRERRILYIDDSVDIEKFPKTKRWLLNFKDMLDKRNEGKRDIISWCSLHRPRVKAELDMKEKILLQNTRNEALKTRIVATLDDESVYGTQGINFIIPKDGGSLRYLLGILNSKLMNYLFSTKFLNLAIKAEYVKQLRIPSISEKQQKPIIALVDKILAAKKQDPAADTSALEAQIDGLVYALYGLTAEEIAVVEGR